jgi:adenylate kinase family enzyme
LDRFAFKLAFGDAIRQIRAEMPYAIHITGASGSGVTTLGRGLADATDARQLDTDEFYWVPVEPRYSVKREIPERLRLIRAAMDGAAARGWILSGSIGTWGAPLTPLFQLVIYLSTPTEVRLSRLRIREEAEFGHDAIAPGGVRHDDFESFLEWTSHYDAGTREGRSRQTHAAFLAALTCPVLRLDGTLPPHELVRRTLAQLTA